MNNAGKTIPPWQFNHESLFKLEFILDLKGNVAHISSLYMHMYTYIFIYIFTVLKINLSKMKSLDYSLSYH